MTDGKLITIEGIDASGTTTQVNEIYDILTAYTDVTREPSEEITLTTEPTYISQTHEPTDRPIGSLIREHLRKEKTFPDAALALLFAADRLDHDMYTISPILNDGAWLITDRYYLSSLSYQALTLEDTFDNPVDWLQTINTLAPEPDLTIYLDISVETALERMETRLADKERFETRSELENIQQYYEQAIALLQENDETIVIVDGEQPISDVTDDIMTEIHKHLD